MKGGSCFFIMPLPLDSSLAPVITFGCGVWVMETDNGGD